jgi:hypothetical protein
VDSHFDSSCKAYGKVCSIVIDDESCEKIVSQEMEKKVDMQLIYDCYLDEDNVVELGSPPIYDSYANESCVYIYIYIYGQEF